MRPGFALLQIVPKVDIFADGCMHAADVAHEPAVEEDPHIVVAEEVIFQRADIVLCQREFHGVLHAEEGIVRLTVVAGRERTVTAGKSGIRFLGPGCMLRPAARSHL